MKSAQQRYKPQGSPLASEDNCSGHVAPSEVHLQSYIFQQVLKFKQESRGLIIPVTLSKDGLWMSFVIKTHI